MNLLAADSLDKFSLHVLVERLESGHFRASVPELVDCVASAETRESAIAAVQEKVTARLKNIEVLTLEVPKNPWLDFIGMFKGDKDFEEIAAELRAERELDFDTDGAA
jgi:predicted RNase H-like HicB family nuclease